MFQGTFESRQITTENTDAPVITDANLYIKNIDYDISDEALYNVFSKLGEITSHHIVRDTMKRSRGFGFMYVLVVSLPCKPPRHTALGFYI